MKVTFNINKTKIAGGLAVMAATLLPLLSIAQEAAATAETPPIGKYQMMRYILTGMAVLLGLVIVVMAAAVGSAGKMYWEKTKKSKLTDAAKKIVPAIMLLFATGFSSFAQDAAKDAAAPASTQPTVPHDIYLFFVIVGIEILIIMALSRMLLKFLTPEKEAAPQKVNKFSFQEIFKKVNQTVAIEDEEKIDLKHDYDGIRELDNKVPKWWQYGFYASILFGIVYIYRMFVAGTMPDQIQELNEANKIAAIQKEEYLKNAANNVDENTVVMMDAAGISEGASIYAKNCLACHGDKGQGGVGPNLTDEYWLHKGGIKDIFYSVKYGWPEKGMKAWKDDFSPGQMAQVSSYIVSLKGTNPPAAKEAQGELYSESADAAPATTAPAAGDSAKTN